MGWPEQFERSYDAHAFDADIGVAELLPHTRDAGAAGLGLAMLHGQLAEPLSLIETPIEEAMFVALLTIAYRTFRQVRFDYRVGAGPMEEGFWICPQLQMGRYRVDFYLRACEFTPAGAEVFTDLIVECDGHEYHDLTKEQASRDRARDRFFQRATIPFYRFTGSDIWRDVFGCADEAMKVLNRQLDRQGERRLRINYEANAE